MISGFEIKTDDLELLETGDIIGTFHTHPGKSSNLTMQDFYTFKMWPRLKHYIVGKDGVSCYSVRSDGIVIREG